MCVCVCGGVNMYTLMDLWELWGSWHSRRSDGTVSLQPGRVPDLGLDGEAAELHGARAELHPDGCSAIMVELVFGEAGQQIALSYTRFSY